MTEERWSRILRMSQSQRTKWFFGFFLLSATSNGSYIWTVIVFLWYFIFTVWICTCTFLSGACLTMVSWWCIQVGEQQVICSHLTTCPVGVFKFLIQLTAALSILSKTGCPYKYKLKFRIARVCSWTCSCKQSLFLVHPVLEKSTAPTALSLASVSRINLGIPELRVTLWLLSSF